MKKLFQNIEDWVGMLFGRPRKVRVGVVDPKTGQVATEPPPQEVDDMNPGDSVAEDLKKFKGFTGKILGSAKSKTAEVANSDKVKKGLIGSGLLSKLIKFFILIIILLVLAFFGMYIFRSFKGEDGNGNIFVRPSPTPVTFTPAEQSVYANDTEILRLEEDIKVLENELSQTNIRESAFTAPTLDFNISF